LKPPLDKFPFFPSRFFRTATEAINWLEGHLESAVCVSLDHDLEPHPFAVDVDPGTGREVADFLARREPRCPVVIHSSNLDAAIGMQYVLEEHQWSVARLAPYGDLAWVNESWLPAIRNAIVANVEHSLPSNSPLVQDR
jgi:hypothetical protein